MTTEVNPRNPTGVRPTQAQLDESERQDHWQLAIRAGLDYYICGRFAIAQGFIPVGANILHHAVELLLKGCLAYDDSLETIRTYGWKSVYGHDLGKLWEAFKARQKEPVPAEFDAVIKGLHDFENIRYPDKLIRDGALIVIDRYDVPKPAERGGPEPEPLYQLKLPEIDRLMDLLVRAAHADNDFFLARIKNDDVGMRHYANIRLTLFGATTP